MTQSILPALLKGLEEYLQERDAAWQRQPAEDRQPTLPTTSDGRANVAAIVRDLEWPESHQQHIHRKPVLKSVINAVAIAQGLKPIGPSSSEDLEKVVADRMRRTEKRASEMSKLVAEQASVIEKQRRTIDGLREQIRIFEESGQVLRTAPVRS